MNLDVEIADAMLAQEYPFKFQLITKAREFTVVNSAGFVSVHMYFPHIEPVSGEIGVVGDTRYVVVR